MHVNIVKFFKFRDVDFKSDGAGFMEVLWKRGELFATFYAKYAMLDIVRFKRS